jgi:hypothetical protein
MKREQNHEKKIPANEQKSRRAYDFFLQQEREESIFTLEQFCEYTKYAPSTAAEYLKKKWHWFIALEPDGYSCHGFEGTDEEAFVALHAQRVEPPGETVEKIVEKVVPKFIFARYVEQTPVLIPLHFPKTPPKNGQLLLLFLLFVIMQWYHFSRTHHVNVWHLYFPITL